MKLGVSNYSFGKHMRATGCTLEEVCDLTKKIGFDSIDFTQDSVKGYDDPVARARELRAYCEKIGLPIGAYTVGANLTAGEWNEEEQNKWIKELKGQVDVAEAYGVTVMRHDVGFSIPEGKTWEESIPYVAPIIREVTLYAKAKGVRTCSENHGMVFQEPERMEAVFNAVGDSNYGWLVDIGNFYCADVDPLEAIDRALPYVMHVHVKDFLYFKKGEKEIIPEGLFFNRFGNGLRGTILGHGIVPVVECIRKLRAAGYEDGFTLEFEGAEDCLSAIEASFKYMKKISELPVVKA